jgi:hypothetical protein
MRAAACCVRHPKIIVKDVSKLPYNPNKDFVVIAVTNTAPPVLAFL